MSGENTICCPSAIPQTETASATPSISSPVLRRRAEVLDGEPDDPEVRGEFIVVEPGDTAAALEEASGCPILTNPFEGSRYRFPDFAPVSEWIEGHGMAYEAYFLFADAGAGVCMVVPAAEGIDAEFLSLCAQFAEPSLTR